MPTLTGEGDANIDGHLARRRPGQVTSFNDQKVYTDNVDYGQAYEDAAADQELFGEVHVAGLGELVKSEASAVIDNPLLDPVLWPTAYILSGTPAVAWAYIAPPDDPMHINAGVKYSDEGVDYVGVQSHDVTDPNWQPKNVPALFKIYRASGDIWVQPVGSHDVYLLTSLVTHAGDSWISKHEANSWEPGVVNETIWEKVL